MGNTNQTKKIPHINKTQLQVACTKSRIHLQMIRDRKNAEIVKGERQLVAKLKSHGRNKIQELLLAERVTNALKYAQACNQLASYAASLKAQANYIAQNVSNPQKIQPWLMYIYSLQFAADHMGLSSLNDFRSVIRSLYDTQNIIKYCNQDIVLLLSPTPSPQELNIYMIQMSERNQIPLEEINIIGHKFTKQWEQPSVQLDQQILELKKHLANQMAQNMQNGNNNGNNGPNNGDFPGGQSGQGSQGQGGQGQGGQGQGGQGQGGQGGYPNQGDYNGGYGNQGQGGNNYPVKQQNEQINPYQGASSINTGPKYYEPENVKPQIHQKPQEFTSFEDMMRLSQKNNHKLPLYPDIDPKEYKPSQYKPVHNPFTPPEQQQNHNSPTLSQIMRDFDKK